VGGAKNLIGGVIKEPGAHILQVSTTEKTGEEAGSGAVKKQKAKNKQLVGI